MNSHRCFGTDGIRGKVGKGLITPNFMLKLGYAIGKVLLIRYGSGIALIGKDTRVSGYMLELALGAGLTAAGLSVSFIGFMPTPAVAYLTKLFKATVGLVISASHNLYHDNGIKIFSIEGTKISNDLENDIEIELNKPIKCTKLSQLGKNRTIDISSYYIAFCKTAFPTNISLQGLKIVLDCANGATYCIAPKILRDLGAEVITIGCQPNGININQKCGATDIRLMRHIVLSEKADLGISYDGDGDRVIMVDHLGKKVDGDQILYIIVKERLRYGQLIKGVVGTIMSNMGLENALKQLEIDFVRTSVGDRYVLEKMKENGWYIGAESSGHVILLDKTTTSDGIIVSLQILSAMIINNMSLNDLCKNIRLFPQVLLNVKFNGQKNPLESTKIKRISIKIERQLAGRGRFLLRKSGTEPLIRIMVEGEEEKYINRLAYNFVNVLKTIS